MNHETQLKLQSYIDGELSPKETREVEELLRADAQAREMHTELSWTRAAIAGNEMERPVADTREFYWSQVQRRIAAEEGKAQPSASPALSWRRFLAPFTAVALITIIAFSARFLNVGQETWLAEVENLADETSSVSFRSKSENMFVVWVYDKSEETSIGDGLMEETTIQ